MLRCCLARLKHLLNPRIRHPLAEKVSHRADENVARLLPTLRLAQSVAMEGWGKVIRIWFYLSTVSARRVKHSALDFRLVQHMAFSVVVPCIISHQLSFANISTPACIRRQVEPPTPAKPLCNPPRVAVFAAM